MNLLFILKILVVVFFLFMFWRGSKLVWGIGLLAVTAAVLFDTVVGVFGRETVTNQLGAFSSFITGLIFAGSAFWLWGLIRPHVAGLTAAEVTPTSLSNPTPAPDLAPAEDEAALTAASMRNEAAPYDRQMLYEQILQNLGPDDVRDLIFDLDIAENEVIAPGHNMAQIIVNVMDVAYERNQMSDLALAVERILTPVPADHLPRLEKLSVSSPPTVLRRYILAHYFLSDIEEMTDELGVDWELMGLGSKQNKVRNLLLYLKRRNRLGELIDLMQSRQSHRVGE